MEEYICRIAQKGFFAGPVVAVSAAAADVCKTEANPSEETAKLDRAIEKLKHSLELSSASEENAKVMETVALMLEDDMFIGEIKKYINDENCNAEYAVKVKSAEYAKKMEDSDSEYLRTRSSDIAGVGEQIINLIGGKDNSSLAVLSALVAADISPAQMAAFNSDMIGGIITDKGSPNSHLSILSGNLEIPYVYGNAQAVAAATECSFIIIDEDKVIINPESNLKAEAEARMDLIRSEKEQQKKSDETIECKTKVYANISGPEDIPKLLSSGADGVGLFRSEFLFLGKDAKPGEEEQYLAYKSVLEAMGNKEVIIRTMDLGSDKSVRWLNLPKEPNPALGLRGVRVSLEKKEIFNTQLRALLRAGVCGNLKIMFPMIASEWEIDEIKKCVNSAAAELEKEKAEYTVPKLGIMIETPSAAVTMDILAKKVDFVSIGTNDLTQYTLALDREANGLEDYFDPHHESVLRLIESVAKECRKNNITSGICGALAADSDVTERLIASGIDELSVPLSKIRQTKINALNAENKLSSAKKESSDSLQNPAVTVLSPVDGETVSMEEISDPVFSSGQLGKCIGIIPENGNIYAPFDGTVVGIAQTLHALTVRADSGEEYLLHIGINTVELGGKGFKVLVGEGERVSKSQKIMEADLELIKESGYSTMVIIVKL